MKMNLPVHPKILITRTDRVGDLVVSTPVFQILREQFPQSFISACVFLEHRELMTENPYLNEVILYDKRGREKNWFGQIQFAQKIKARKFDLVIHLHATNRMHLMGWLAGIPNRIGYNRRAAWALTQAFPYDKKEGAKHESSYLCDFLGAAGLLAQPAGSPLPFVPVLVGMQTSVENLLLHHRVGEGAKLAVIHPSASDETKMWPAAPFAELIQKLKAAHSDWVWISIGDAKASEQTQKIGRASGAPIINLCGQLSLGMLAALFQKAKLVISNDSGPAHIAAAVGAPTVSIFGRWQPGLNAERWRPLGKKTAIVTPQIENIPEAQRKFTYIEEITVPQVLGAVTKVLA